MNDFINIEDMQEYNQFIEEMQKCSNDYEFSLQKMATKIRDTFLSLTAFETYRYDDNNVIKRIFEYYIQYKYNCAIENK